MENARNGSRSGQRYPGWEQLRRDTEVKPILGYLHLKQPLLCAPIAPANNATVGIGYAASFTVGVLARSLLPARCVFYPARCVGGR